MPATSGHYGDQLVWEKERATIFSPWSFRCLVFFRAVSRQIEPITFSPAAGNEKEHTDSYIHHYGPLGSSCETALIKPVKEEIEEISPNHLFDSAGQTLTARTNSYIKLLEESNWYNNKQCVFVYYSSFFFHLKVQQYSFPLRIGDKLCYISYLFQISDRHTPWNARTLNL